MLYCVSNFVWPPESFLETKKNAKDENALSAYRWTEERQLTWSGGHTVGSECPRNQKEEVNNQNKYYPVPLFP